jgi:hypothetical protein
MTASVENGAGEVLYDSLIVAAGSSYSYFGHDTNGARLLPP